MKLRAARQPLSFSYNTYTRALTHTKSCLGPTQGGIDSIRWEQEKAQEQERDKEPEQQQEQEQAQAQA